MTAKKARGGHAEVTASIRDNVGAGLQRIKAKMTSFAASSARIGGALLGGALAGGSLFIGPISAASRLQETMAKFDVVFGENAKTVKNWSDNFGKEVGRSNEQIASFMAASQDLLVPMGLEPGAATEMSKQITGLAVDLASFNNMNDADTQRDLQSALTGSGEVMKKYGVVLSEAAVKQELLNQSIDPKAATNAQKVYARMNIILAGTTAAQGDAVRSGNSWANTQKRIFAELDNTLATIGNALLPTLSEYGNKVAWLIEKSSEWISVHQSIVQNLAIGLGVMAAAGAGLLGMSIAAAGASATIGLFNGVVAFGTGIVTVFTATIGIAATVLGAIASPFGIVAALLVGGAAAWLYYSGTGSQAIEALSNRMGQLLEWGKMVFGGIYNAIAAGNWELAGSIMWTALQVAWQTGIGTIMGYWIDFKFGLLSSFDLLKTGLITGFQVMVHGIGKSLLWLIDKANAVSETLAGYKLIEPEAFSKALDDSIDQTLDKNASGLIEREQKRLDELKKQKAKYSTDQLSDDLAKLTAQAKKERDAIQAELEKPAATNRFQAKPIPTLTTEDKKRSTENKSLGGFDTTALAAFAQTRTKEEKLEKLGEQQLSVQQEIAENTAEQFELNLT